MRILQLSDPHLVAADADLVRERPAMALLERALLEGQRDHPDLVLLNSHRSSCSAGWLGPHQLQLLQRRLADPLHRDLPLVVALHHPPVAIGHPVMDTMNLSDHQQLAAILQPHASLRAVVFGHNISTGKEPSRSVRMSPCLAARPPCLVFSACSLALWVGRRTRGGVFWRFTTMAA